MKNLNNISDDELDKLFRQASEEESDSLMGEAWGKMEHLLDDNKTDQKLAFWKKNAFWALALLFLTGGGITFLNYNSSKKQNSKTSINKDEIAITNTKPFTKNNIEDQNKTLIETKTYDPQKIENRAKNENNTEFSNSVKEPNQLKTESGNNFEFKKYNEKQKIENPQKSGENKTEISSKLLAGNANNIKNKVEPNQNIRHKYSVKNEVSNSQNHLAATSIPVSENFNSKRKENNIDKIKFEKSTSPQLTTKSPIGSALAQTNDNQAFKVINTTQNNRTELQQLNIQLIMGRQGKLALGQFTKNIEIEKPILPKIALPKYFKKGLYLSANISPDISTVGSNEFGKVGSNYGAFLEYRFTKRVSVQAGAFRSIKYYDAYPDQYTWAWGTPPTPLKEIGAKCKMMDYPINLGYDITQKTNSRLFTSLGLTTYKMMEETYNYDYVDNASPKIKHRYWKGNTGKTFLTSNLNLSIGLEKQIAKKLSIQIEPFAKVPLKNIGFGNIPLISYGLMFSGKIPIITQKK